MKKNDLPIDSVESSESKSDLSGSRAAMEPLYEQLLQQDFPSSAAALEFCRHACALFGFTVKQETSANRNIYVYCSREGIPDSQRKPKTLPQRKRSSKRCDCRWRVVLAEVHGRWAFRKLSANASEHNHEMSSPAEILGSWPPAVNDLIIQLARQNMQTHEIREIVKQQFPGITWNERRFYNRLTEERKRIKQRNVVLRAQQLLVLSARLCSVVAANDEWSAYVKRDLSCLLDKFCHLSQLSPESIDSLTDIASDQIHMQDPLWKPSSQDTDMTFQSSPVAASKQETQLERLNKKRKSMALMADEGSKITHTINVPAYTLHIPAPLVQPSPSEVTSSSSSSSSSWTVTPMMMTSSASSSLFSLASPTSPSSSTSMNITYHRPESVPDDSRSSYYAVSTDMPAAVPSIPSQSRYPCSIPFPSSFQPPSMPRMPSQTSMPISSWDTSAMPTSFYRNSLMSTMDRPLPGGGPEEQHPTSVMYPVMDQPQPSYTSTMMPMPPQSTLSMPSTPSAPGPSSDMSWS
ncbi:uncharacterized protein BYT42DRAFT_543248 [Radiomyces spectabilis]|uniref:uncharacterized protein n=1 Tax=Radiomyces spectabilis TaxID=64574 RepID=UPI002220ABDC|nr:uncharacterized protein BYT42DRAFT_543248 [Radiomyces spectabilis]KAI8391747.1 hypothetical protein BYT42DRAFT_543248 [Radiomyces spectabilis]